MTATVLSENERSTRFTFKKGVRQGDSLSTTLFNMALEYTLRKIDKSGTIRTRGGQVIAYADDVVVIIPSKEKF